MFKKIIAALLASLLVAMQFVPAFAQEEQQKLPTATPLDPSKQDQQVETVKVGTSVVQLDAIVTDKSGRRITGLTAADFQVLDEGGAQPIDFFSAIEGSRALRTSNTATAANTGGTPSTPAAPAAPVSSLAIPYQGRHIALVFDDLNLSSDNFLRSRRAFTDYINHNLTPNDMVALISTGGALASMQQFTNDKERLLTALNRIAAQPRAGDIAQRQVGMTDTEAIRIDSGDRTALQNVMRRSAVVDDGPSNTLATGANNPLNGVRQEKPNEDNGVDETKIRNAARVRVSEIGTKARANLSTLSILFHGMADLPGRKIVILMTESFVTAGGTSEDISNQLIQLIEAARRAGVSVYSLDAQGLRTDGTKASEEISGSGLAFKNINPDLTMGSAEQLGAARALAYGTGGEMIANTNSLIAGLQKAIDDSSSYYVVGFKPSNLDNKFHKLSVTIKGKPDLIVRTRKGYLAANEETIKGTEGELIRALKSPVPLLDLPVEMVANVVPSSGGFVVVTGLHVGRNYLSLPAANATDQTASYEVVAYVFGAGRDKAVGGVVKTLTYDLAKDPAARQKLKTEGFVYVPQPFSQGAFEPGVYQMRAVVREKTSGAVGSAYQFFEVPDPKDHKTVTMSSIVMTATGQTGFNGMNSFKPASDVDMRYVIFNLPQATEGWSQHVKLIDAKGAELFNMELPFGTGGADKSQASQGTSFNLPPARGRYALVVTVKDAKGKVDLERRTDFTIE